jgi:hypothetical protein
VEWTQKQLELDAAFKKDKERMTQLNDILSKVSHSIISKPNLLTSEKPQGPRTTTAKVTVNVSIHDKSPEGRQLGTISGTLFRLDSKYMLT